MRANKGKGLPYDAPALRRRAQTVLLRAPTAAVVKDLRERLKRGSGPRRFVYRTHDRCPRIVIANHEIPGRNDLVGTYDSSVTAAMIRQDLYGEDAHEIKFAEWGERRVA